MRNIVAPGTDDEYVEKLLLVCELAASLLRTNSTNVMKKYLQNQEILALLH